MSTPQLDAMHMLDACFDSPWLSTLDEFDLSWLPEELLSPSTTGSEQTCEPLSGAACTAHSTRASSSSATSSSHSYSPSQLSSQQQLLLCRHNDAQDCAKQIVSSG
ncbi:hypothetical protein HaLaN_21709, partial [Haematococcus lacustris]